MKVSFCGFNNIYIGKHTQPESILGSYIDENGDVKVGKKYTDWVKVRAKLDDDLDNQDLTDFQNLLANSNNHLQKVCVNKNSPDVVELTMQQTVVDKDDTKFVANSNFILNGVHIALTKREMLPFYSFMAKMTKRIIEDGYRSDSQKELLTRFNDAIQNKAMDYIENVMPVHEED